MCGRASARGLAALALVVRLAKIIGRRNARDALESQGKIRPRPEAHIFGNSRNGEVPIVLLVAKPPAGLGHTSLIEELLEILVIPLVDDMRHIYVVRLHKCGQLMQREVLRAEDFRVVDRLVYALQQRALQVLVEPRRAIEARLRGGRNCALVLQQLHIFS